MSPRGSPFRRLALLLAAMAAAAATCGVKGGAAACTKVRNVLVIGAGMSGAAAARHIATTNGACFKVTVLEARDRVGGRMWSRTEAAPAGSSGVLRAEMGAQWIQSATGNPITALAKRYKLRIGQQNGEETQYFSNGEEYSSVRRTAAESRYQVLARRARLYANRQDNDISVDAAFRAAGGGGYLSPYIQSRVAVDYEFEYGGPMTSMSAWYYEDEAFSPPDLVVTNGYDNIPKKHMQEAVAAGATLVLNFAVSSITRAASGISVTGADTASGASKTYAGDVAIITLPLGVLKANAVAFSPALSARKRGAIRRLGVGTINKVFFFFNTTFWPAQIDEYFIEEDDLPRSRGKWVDWVNLKRAWGQTALQGCSVGEYADRMAKMTPAQAIGDAYRKLNAMFPAAKRRNVRLLATWLQRWNTDPYARGAYSYAKVGTQGDGDRSTDFDKLGEAEGRFLFAGEHTHPLYRSSVHGAYLSGVREAKRALRSF